MMGQPPGTRLTSAIAREICIRTSSAVALDGSIAPIGNQYVLGLRAMDCSSGKIIAHEEVQAARKEDVLRALDRIANNTRARLRESLANDEKYDNRVSEAYGSFHGRSCFVQASEGRIICWRRRAALLFLLRAVELDPNFASAYTLIALIYSYRLEPERAAEAIRKSYGLRDRVNELERRVSEANYYILATGELERAEQLLNVLKDKIPGAPQPRNNLGNVYTRLGNHEKAREDATEAVRLESTNPLYCENLGADYVSLNRLDDAAALYKQAEVHGRVTEGSARSRYLLAFLKGDESQMAQLSSSAAGKPVDEDAMLATQADTAAWYGKLNEARDLTARAIDSAHRNGVREIAGAYQAESTLFEVDSGDWKQGLTDAYAAIKLSQLATCRRWLHLPLPGLAIWQRQKGWLSNSTGPTRQILCFRAIGSLRSMLQELCGETIQIKPANCFRSRAPPSFRGQDLFPVYLRGEAYLRLHDGKRAATEFQKFIDHRGLVRNSPWGALGRLGLARAYAMQLDNRRARIQPIRNS